MMNVFFAKKTPLPIAWWRQSRVVFTAGDQGFLVLRPNKIPAAPSSNKASDDDSGT